MRARVWLGLAIGLGAGAGATALAGCPAPSSASLATGGRALNSSSPEAAGQLGPLEPTPDPLRYFPLKKNFFWTYVVKIKEDGATKAATYSYRVTAATASAGVTTATMSIEHTTGGQTVPAGFLTATVSGARITLTQDGSSDTIDLPLADGKTFTSGSLTARAFLLGDMVVKGKTYEGVYAISYSRDDQVVAVRWVAPRVGLIKEVRRSRSETKTWEATNELTRSYSTAIKSVGLNLDAVEVKAGETAEIQASAPTEVEGSYSEALSFVSGDPTVVTVQKGKAEATAVKATLTGVKAGTASVLVKSDLDPDLTDTLLVTVK